MGELLVALYLASGAAASKPPSAEIELACEYGAAVYVDGVDSGTCLDGRVSITVRPGRHRVGVKSADGVRSWKDSVALLKGERVAFEVAFGDAAPVATRVVAAMATPALVSPRPAHAPSSPGLPGHQVVPIVVALAGTAAATIELRVATLAPKASAAAKTLSRAAARIEKDTGGAVVVKVLFDGKEGDEQEVLRKLKLGQLEGAVMTGIGLSALAPALRVLDAPMLFRDQAEVDAVRAALVADLDRELAAANVVRLGWADPGFAHLFSQDSLQGDSLRGTTVLVPQHDDAISAWLKEARVRQSPIGIPDILPTLNTGVHQAVIGTSLMAVALQWYTRLIEASDQHVAYASGAIVVSSLVWSQIAASDQQLVLAAFADAERDLAATTTKDNGRARKAMIKQGVSFTALSSKLTSKLEAAAKTSNARYAAGIGATQLLADIEAELARIRGAATSTTTTTTTAP